jgi:2-iminobutanoate/2-iminopropanoate deaminase
MPKHIVNNVPCAPLPNPVFSQAVISHRNVYVSGSIGCNEEGLIVGGVQQQTIAALDIMTARLDAAGSDLEHVVKVNVYLTHLERDFVVFNEIYTSVWAMFLI